MQLIDGAPVFSATDLVGYLACEHLTNLDRAVLAGVVERPHYDDVELDVIRRRGFEHEKRYLDDLLAEGRSATEIRPDGFWAKEPDVLRRAAAETAAAIRRGDDVIYQATFFDGRWLGFADFLLRVERPSAVGTWSYEVTDTKLAHSVKASAVLQMCSYVDQLTSIQGREPEWMHVALGGSARAVADLRVADYMAYYRAVKAWFEAAVVGAHGTQPPPPAYPPLGTYPDPVEHCDVCRWRVECDRRRHADDHLSLVAGISGGQRRALGERGIETVEALAASTLPFEPRLERTTPEAIERVREQARIQVIGRHAGRVLHELLQPITPDRGLTRLPPPSAGDLFFDIEGDPYALDDGLEYLFGFTDPSGRNDSANAAYVAFWGLDRAGEKAAFERAIDLIVERLDADPAMHVYHFAPYEPTAVKRLMGRHATREAEVDRLLRGGVFVDLHRIVRQSVRASVESYSIKKLEPLYAFTREIDLRDAGSSIAAFEKWLQLGDEASRADDPDILARIEAYNRDDCVSNRRLRDWLEERRREVESADGVALPRPQPAEGQPSEQVSENEARVQALVERLTAGVSADRAERSDVEQARWLLAQLLSWHRREDKSFWWNWYRMLDLTDEERIEDDQALGGLTYEGVVREENRSLVHRYRFPAQEFEVRVGGEARDPRTDRAAGTVVEIDEGRHTIDLKRGRTSEVPHPTSLVPFDWFNPREQRESLLRLADWVVEHDIDAEGSYRAARDLL
ncbi:MAG: TM0106 family RecB-like putative nuclease, partial [Chloroflexota bacterium]|nr:TM0106 family RecB-like putative nuclease [Chloroflexota bacterium]